MTIVIRVLAIGLGIGLALVAGRSAADRLARAELTQIATFIEAGEDLAPTTIATALDVGERRLRAGDCEDETVRATVTVQLGALELAVASESLTREALVSASGLLRTTLACSPADGNIWIRLALVEQALGTDAAVLSALVSGSVQRAPAEITVLAARMVFWQKADAATRALAGAALETDLTTILAFANPADAVAVLAPVQTALEPQVAAIVARLPAERRNELFAAGFTSIGPSTTPAISDPLGAT